MGNTLWSTYVQRAETLYRSRGIRFRNEYRGQYLDALGLRNGMHVLEVGCGPGVLCHRLKEWLPDSDIAGIDRDEEFIGYAKAKSLQTGLNCAFFQGDALCLPFEDNSFDACTSHTVIEHLPTLQFLSEQYRVCRPGGVVSVMSSRTEAAINPENWQPPVGEEQELWDKVEGAAKDSIQRYNVCQHPCTVPQIPRFMEQAGFKNVSVDFVAVTSAPDSARYDTVLREEMVESNRQVALDAIILAQNYAPGVWTQNERKKLETFVNRRFDDRLEAMHQGVRIWDISVSMLMIARGYKLN